MRASDINEAMKLAAAKAIAGLVSLLGTEARLHHRGPLRQRVGPPSRKLAKAAIDSGIARAGDRPGGVLQVRKQDRKSYRIRALELRGGREGPLRFWE